MIRRLHSIGIVISMTLLIAIIVIRVEVELISVHVYLSYLAHLCTNRPDNARFGIVSLAHRSSTDNRMAVAS